MSLSSVLRSLRNDPGFMRCVTAWERIPARPARTAPWPAALDPRLIAAVGDQEMDRAYVHQAQAIEATLAGKHVVLATTTASGKTMAYNLPVFHVLLNDPAACALYLFPTKALAYDQLAVLGDLEAQLTEAHARGHGDWMPVGARSYDGDTPSSVRSTIRRESRILVSNPDMLHMGILPHHTRWARLFSNLRFVVLDEIHTYRGVFGGHVANVLRRLQRICRFYGSDPRFICASATIANPRKLAEALIESPCTLVKDDGAPRGDKHFILYNPPVVDSQLGIRRSAILAAQDIAARFLKADVPSIVFARARLTTEVLLGYLRDSVAAAGGPQKVKGYRGGYLPNERRAIEHGLRTGEVKGVVATNALELGVDIGRLDACVITGYPGSVAWQQAGRAGRRVSVSAAVLVASALPLDQYLITHPRYFFGQPVEQALIDPDNLAVLARHLTCATFELPFNQGEPFGMLEDVGTLLDLMAEEGRVYRGNGRYTWVGEGYPAAGLSLRTSTPDHVVIQVGDHDKPEGAGAGSPRVIGQMDRPSVPVLLHDGAVYLHAGATYIVEALDWEKGVATVQAAEVDYYTRSSSTTDVQVLEAYPRPEDGDGARPAGAIKGSGDVLVTARATGYRKIKRYTHEVLSWAPINLPEQELRTVGYWLALSEEMTVALQKAGVLPPPVDYGPNWPTQRDNARARDGYRCRRCGAPEQEGRHHHVHHITPFRAFGYVQGVNDLFALANQLENLISLCSTCHRQVERASRARGALSGLAYLIRNLAPLYLMCDAADLGSAVQARAPQTGLPTVTLYDRAPGGAGLSVRLYELHEDLLEAVLDVVRSCPCADGCPGCVGPSGEVGSGTKALTGRLLESILQRE